MAYLPIIPQTIADFLANPSVRRGLAAVPSMAGFASPQQMTQDPYASALRNTQGAFGLLPMLAGSPPAQSGASITGAAPQVAAPMDGLMGMLSRPYESAPDSLMGFKKNGPQTPFDQSNYKFTQWLKIKFPGMGESFVDAIKGLNGPHAMERAARNWPGAEFEAISPQEAQNLDPKAGAP